MFCKTAFGILLCSAIPMFATSAYTATTSEQFGTIILSGGGAGTFALLGTTEVGSTPENLSAGLGEAGGQLYGAVSGTNTLYSIDTSDGALTDVGTTTTSEYQDLGSTPTSLYAIDAAANLYSVDPTTGAFTLIGPTGLAQPGTASLSNNSSTLYFAEFNSGAYQLYTIDTTSGAATLVGTTSTPIGALMWDGASVLYGIQDSPATPAVDTLSTTNGAVTVGPAVTGATGDLTGLAPLITTTTPEPGTWGFLGIGIAALMILKRPWRTHSCLPCRDSSRHRPA